MSFPERVEGVVLAGGRVDLNVGPKPAGKGLLPVGGLPLAAHAVRALANSRRISRVVVVSPVPELSGPDWSGTDLVVRAGERLMESFSAGVGAALEPHQPVLVSCGDLPFLTEAAVTDFVERCARRPEVDIWYGYLRRERSEHHFPGVRHTWARLADGTYCGTGMMMLRPRVVAPLEAAMASLTHARKHMLKLASCLGWSTVLAYLMGRLTVPMAEQAGGRLFGVPCAGVESPYAETGFNVDDDDTLAEARRRLEGPRAEVEKSQA